MAIDAALRIGNPYTPVLICGNAMVCSRLSAASNKLFR